MKTVGQRGGDTWHGQRLPGASRRRQEAFFPRALEGLWPCRTFISDFWSPDMWEIAFLLF